MARNEWERRLYRPVAVRGMEVCVADAAGLGFDQYLTCPRRRDVQFTKRQRLSKLLDYCCFHLRDHCYSFRETHIVDSGRVRKLDSSKTTIKLNVRLLDELFEQLFKV
jgi:hypothetical protein